MRHTREPFCHVVCSMFKIERRPDTSADMGDIRFFITPTPLDSSLTPRAKEIDASSAMAVAKDSIVVADPSAVPGIAMPYGVESCPARACCAPEQPVGSVNEAAI